MAEKRRNEVTAARWTTLVLGVFLFAGLAAAIFIGTPEAPTAALPSLLLELDRDQAKTVDVKVGKEEFHFERDGKDAERWRILLGKALVRAASAKVDDLLHELGRVTPKNRWKAAEVRPEERATWGLDAPSATLTVGLGGREIRVQFGKHTSEDQNCYVTRSLPPAADGKGADDAADVWVVPVEILRTLEGMRASDWRESRPLGFSGSEVASLAIERGDAPRLEASKPGGSGSTWEVTSPWQGDAKHEVIEGLLGKLLHVEATQFVEDGNPDLDRYGLLRPRARVSVRRKGREAPLVIAFGAATPEGNCWFHEEGEPSVYACPGALPDEILALDLGALRDLNALRLGWAHLDSLEYTAGDAERSWRLVRVLERWDLEKPERVPAETAAVNDLLEVLRSTNVVKYLDAPDLAALGLDDPAKAWARLVVKGEGEGSNRDLLLGKPDADGNAPALLLPAAGQKGPGTASLLPKATVDALHRGPLALRTLEIWRIPLDEVVEMSRTAGGTTEAYSFDHGSWKAVAGGPEPDGAVLSRDLARILTLTASACEAKTKEGLATWGVADPPTTATIRLKMKKGEVRTLLVGNAVEGGSHYVRLGEGDVVFRLADRRVDGVTLLNVFDALTEPWSKTKTAEEPKKEEPPPPPPPPEERPKEDAPKEGAPKKE